MKRILLFLLLFFSLSTYNSIKAQDLQWVRKIGNQQTDEAESIDVDNNGNSYFIGVNQSYTYDLDPTPNGTQIIDNSSTPYSPYRDIYLVKLYSNGNFAWGKTFGNLKYDQYAYKIKIGTDGNIYLFLQTTERITYNQIGTFITIIKISPDGEELSKIKIESHPGKFYTRSFDIDIQNNFVISGWFFDSRDLFFNNANVNFESQNTIASYIFKLDNSGNFIWKKIFDYPELADLKIETKPDGNIIALLNTSEQGSTTYSILNIDTNNANILWEKKLTQQGAETFHIDKLQNIIIAGRNDLYQGTIDVDPSSNIVNIASEKYLLWLDKNGNFIDAKEYFVQQYSSEFRMSKIDSDSQNNVYVVGDFNGKIDADPSSNTFFLEHPNGLIQYGSGFAIKFDSSRNFNNAYTLMSNYRSIVKDIKVKNKSLYLLGDFNWECDFDPGVGTHLLSSLNEGGVTTSDGFVLKLSPCDPSKPNGDENQLFCFGQNATIEDLTPNLSDIQWYDTPINGNILSTTTPLQNGKIYYASQTSNNCETERLTVNVTITNSPEAPAGNTSQAFCKNQNATLNNIQISGQNIKWYDSNTTTSTLANTTLLENNKTYYASQTVGCESDRTAVLVQINDTPLPTGSKSQQFCITENATIANLNITGTNLKWYDSTVNGNNLQDSTLQNGIYYVTQTLNNCESERYTVSVKIKNTPIPIADSPQVFCVQKNALIKDIDISGQNLKWYDSNASSISLTESTLLENGNTYYVSQTADNCESERYAVTVKVQDTQIPIADSPQAFCIQKNALIRDIAISGQNIKWYDSSASPISLTESTPLENEIIYYASQTTNNCESDRIPITISILKATTADCINLVDELPFPKFFTPNGDGFNDFWTIDFAYLAPKSTIKIFDRYGKLIKELTSDTSWDGTYLNLPLPSTDYWFVVTRLNGAEFRAHFSLKR